jgi:hypothetical protein
MSALDQTESRVVTHPLLSVQDAAAPRLPPRLDSLAAEIEGISKLGATIDWGFESLNSAAPWPLNSIAAVSAPKGGGKTSLALAVSRRYAATQGPVLYVALEQTAAMIASRAYAQAMGVRQQDLITGAVRVDPAAVGPIPFFVAAKLALADLSGSLDEISSFDERPPLLVVDYIQRYAIGSKDLRIGVLETMDILLRLTESRRMGTLIVSQTSRNGSRRARDGATSGEDLVDVDAESGAIESDAAVKLVVTYKSRNGEEATDVGIVVAKNRFGCVGTKVGFRFEGATGRWTETGVLPPVSPANVAHDRVRDALRAAGLGGLRNKSELKRKAGGNSSDTGIVIEEMLAAGEIVRSPDNGVLVLRELLVEH